MNRNHAQLAMSTFALLAVLGPLLAPAGAQIFYPANPGPDAGWDYVVAPVLANCVEDYRLFLPQPPNVQPANGWPVLIHLDLNSFADTVDFEQLDANASEMALGGKAQRLLARVLNRGIAVITARATPSREFDDSLWDTPELDPQGQVVKPALCPNDPPPTHADLPGHGMFHPPGSMTNDECCSLPDTGCTGLPGPSVEPYAISTWSMAEKDAMMLIQHVRYGARQTSGPLSVLDHRRIAIHGSSAGAAASMWAAFGPDRRGANPLPKVYPPDYPSATGSQYDESTRPDAAVLEHGLVWWPLYVTTAGGFHFGKNGHADCPASTAADISPEDLREGSALFYEDTALNPNLPLLLAYNETNVDVGGQDCFNYCKTFSLSSSCVPFTVACNNFATNAHARWNGFAWKLMYPLRTQLLIWREDNGKPLVPLAEQCPSIPCLPPQGCVQIDNTIVTLDVLHNRIVGWLLANFVNPAPAVWFTIRTAKPNNDNCLAPMSVGVVSSNGSVPELSGSGTLVPGTQVTLSVTGAVAGSSAWLLVGYGNDVAPNGTSNGSLKGRPCLAWQYGGVLVPAPDLFVPLPSVGQNGTLTIHFQWPTSSLPQAERYYQVWLVEGSAVYGTNALMSRAP